MFFGLKIYCAVLLGTHIPQSVDLTLNCNRKLSESLFFDVNASAYKRTSPRPNERSDWLIAVFVNIAPAMSRSLWFDSCDAAEAR